MLCEHGSNHPPLSSHPYTTASCLVGPHLHTALQGNFAQFLESADSVVSLASEGVDGSFVNMFALPELKVRGGRERSAVRTAVVAVFVVAVCFHVVVDAVGAVDVAGIVIGGKIRWLLACWP